MSTTRGIVAGQRETRSRRPARARRTAPRRRWRASSSGTFAGGTASGRADRPARRGRLQRLLLVDSTGRRARARSAVNERGDAVDQVLAVVEDEQHPAWRRVAARSRRSARRRAATPGFAQPSDGQPRSRPSGASSTHPDTVGEVGPRSRMRRPAPSAVLPMPPGPTMVTSGCRSISRAISRSVVIATDRAAAAAGRLPAVLRLATRARPQRRRRGAAPSSGAVNW